MFKRAFSLALFFSIITLFCFAGEKQTLTLADFVQKNSYRSRSIDPVVSLKDGQHYASLQNNCLIVKYHFKTGQAIDTLFQLKNIDDCPFHSISDFTLNSNETRILIKTHTEKIYRYSSASEHYVWDINTKTLYPVSDYGPQQEATFSPDGERIAFVRDNNIFIKTLRFGTEQQVTIDGKKNEIINGLPDWVYEEEFSITRLFDWSPDSKMLAFVKFDEKEVPEYSFPSYKGFEPELTENGLYPGIKSYKYPKAGEKNATVSVHVFELKTRTFIRMDTGEESDIYLPGISWTPNGNDLAIFRLNRRQNVMDILYANPFTGQTRVICSERNQRYIDETFIKNFQFLDDGEHFTLMSERDGWYHLYLYRNNGYIVKQITKGTFDVTAFYGYEQKKKLFYYQAAKKSPLQREVYSITLDGKKEECLSSKEGTNHAKFNDGFQYFINEYSSAASPPVISVHTIQGKILRILEENETLNEKLQNCTLPKKEFIKFSTSQATELYGYLIKPSFFDSASRYPVIISQYSGPYSQEVTDIWDPDWQWYLAEQGYIVACVDPRGTNARGEEFRKCTYLQLGKLETEDLIETAKYLAGLAFIDEKNIGIWGWSYGGYTTLLCMGKGSRVFKAGVAVAPVTSWRFYDSVYTERFMRKPHENPDGYDENSPLYNPGDIQGKLLIIHGTADDNVHSQHTFEYAEALVQKGIQFDMHLYTNRNHSIYGGETRMHLFTKIIGFFNRNLK